MRSAGPIVVYCVGSSCRPQHRRCLSRDLLCGDRKTLRCVREMRGRGEERLLKDLVVLVWLVACGVDLELRFQISQLLRQWDVLLTFAKRHDNILKVA